jgi:cellulose synthase/poly-beta-1,6-N-acetylglucosamine synthase-like glycosyltransferase
MNLVLSLIAGIQIVLLVVLSCFLSYLGALAVLALVRIRKKSFPARAFRRFAVVVPAHNEEVIIERTLKSLKKLDYPEDAFDMIVVADNCIDKTAEIAHHAGAVVLERRIPHLRGKGHALRWCFDEILSWQPGFDAVVVVDADSCASDNLLIIMNHYLETGAKAVQCSDLVEPESGGWSAGITRLSFLLCNLVRPLGRSIIGCSPGLKGNGMCFAAETLREVPWSSFSLSEDLEYGLELLLKGFTIEFASEAFVHAKMPWEADHAKSQRARWEAGRVLVIRNYGRRLLGEFLRRWRFRLLDAWIELVTPSLVNMLAFAFVMTVLNAVGVALGVQSAGLFILLWIGVLSAGMLHVIIGLLAVGATRSDLLGLLYVPRYLWWKARVYRGLAKKGHSREWVRTHRETFTQHTSPKDRTFKLTRGIEKVIRRWDI